MSTESKNLRSTPPTERFDKAVNRLLAQGDEVQMDLHNKIVIFEGRPKGDFVRIRKQQGEGANQLRIDVIRDNLRYYFFRDQKPSGEEPKEKFTKESIDKVTKKQLMQTSTHQLPAPSEAARAMDLITMTELLEKTNVDTRMQKDIFYCFEKNPKQRVIREVKTFVKRTRRLVANKKRY